MKIKNKTGLRKAIKKGKMICDVYIYKNGKWVVGESLSLSWNQAIYSCLIARIYGDLKPGQTIDEKITEIFKEVEGGVE